MQNSTRFGFYGLNACLCSFCLSLTTGLAQESKVSPPENPLPREEAPLPRPTDASLRELQEQNLAVLKAIEQLQEDRDAALQRYTAAVSTQLNALTDAFLSHRAQELQTVRNSNRFILTVTASIAGVAVLIMLFSALLPVWAIKHFATTRPEPQGFFLHGHGSAWSRIRVQFPLAPVARLPMIRAEAKEGEGSSAAKTASAVLQGQPAVVKLDGAIERLERRLQSLEKRALQKSENRNQRESELSPADKVASTPARPESGGAKYSRSPQVAIRLGVGEAISFLPRDATVGRLHYFRGFLGKCKKACAMWLSRRAAGGKNVS